MATCHHWPSHLEQFHTGAIYYSAEDSTQLAKGMINEPVSVVHLSCCRNEVGAPEQSEAADGGARCRAKLGQAQPVAFQRSLPEAVDLPKP